MNNMENNSSMQTSDQSKKWYVIHTYSGFEEKAKQALLERAKNGGVLHRFGDIIIPQTMKEAVTKTGKKKQVSKTSYPGYMIVQMEMDDSTKLLVQNTPRVTGFVGNTKNPRPLPDNEVLRLTSPEAAAAAQKSSAPEIQFEKGESVKVIDGPFSNFDGIVDEVRPDKARVKVLVSIFGRETPVELEYGQVQKLS